MRIVGGSASRRLASELSRSLGVATSEVELTRFPDDECYVRIDDNLGGQDVVVFYQPGQVSALDGDSIRDSRDVGSAAAYDPNLNGQALTFSYADGIITDNETGSRWNIFGQAVAGPLAGEELDQLLAYPHFWFAWAAFQPETAVWGAA